MSALRRYREGVRGAETRGAADPVACATILLVCFCFTLLVPTTRSAPPPCAVCRSIRPLCCGIVGSHPLTSCPSVVAGAQDEGKGGEGRVAPS